MWFSNRPRYWRVGRDSVGGNPGQASTRNPQRLSTTNMSMVEIIIVVGGNCRKDKCEYAHTAEQSDCAAMTCLQGRASSRPDSKRNYDRQPSTEAQEWADTGYSLQSRFSAREFRKIMAHNVTASTEFCQSEAPFKLQLTSGHEQRGGESSPCVSDQPLEAEA